MKENVIKSRWWVEPRHIIKVKKAAKKQKKSESQLIREIIDATI